MSQLASWRFRTMEEDQKHVEPTHREHLATAGAVEPLVRESIQNSLDVTIEGKPTRVAFTLGTAKLDDASPHFDGLWPHLEVIKNRLPDGLPKQNEGVPFLAIEDYNTRGLVGEPSRRNEANQDGTKNHFFRFWHRVGPTGDSKRRGSWGVGKVVFANASRIRTFFGVTFRENDSSPWLMGEAGLIIHKLGNDTHDWYGYYAEHQVHNGHHTLLPIQGLRTKAFSEAFSLSRNSPGLSILVPYVREEVTLQGLAKSVIEQYFLPIVEGRLEVTVTEGTKTFEITKSTIKEVASNLPWSSKGHSSKDQIQALLELAQWQLGLDTNDYILAATSHDGSNTLGAQTFKPSEIEALMEKFATGQRIAVQIPVFVQPKNAPVAREEVRVVLERDDSLRKSNVPHLRSGINIVKMRTHGPNGVRGILVVGGNTDYDQGELDKLLQASEGPAHVNWELQGEGYDKAKTLYDDARKVITFMKDLVSNLMELLTVPQGEKDMRTLAPFFPDSSKTGTAGGGQKGSKKGAGSKEPDAPPPPPIGTISGVVQTIDPTGLKLIEAAVVSLIADGTVTCAATTGVDGSFYFDQLTPGNLHLHAHKEGVGTAQKDVVLPDDAGLRVNLTLRPIPLPKMYTKEQLSDGFAIRGNPDFEGPLKPIRVRLAYAAWGKAKTYNSADFSLEDPKMKISFEGLLESEFSQIIREPNLLMFTPSNPAFHLEVRGFDVNRALHVDPRAQELEEADTNE